MKKPVKITLISLGSLLGLIVVAIGVACWLIFTPARLTSIVNNLAEKYILCDSHFESVNLSLFKTFPDIGLEVHDFSIVNKMEGAGSDTVAAIDQLTVAINLKRFLDDGSIIVHQLLVDNVKAHLYIDSNGISNFDVFPHSEDTTSSSFTLPENIDIEKIKISNLNGYLKDEKDRLSAMMQHLDLNLKGSMVKDLADISLDLESQCLQASLSDSLNREWFSTQLDDVVISVDGSGSLDDMKGNVKLESKCIDAFMKDSICQDWLSSRLNDVALSLEGKGSLDQMKGRMKMTLPSARFVLAGTSYINDFSNSQKDDLLTLDIPFEGSVNQKHIRFDEAELDLTEHQINLSGEVSLPHDSVSATSLDIDFKTNRWNVATLLAMLPQQFVSWEKGMSMDADITLDGKAKGQLGSGHLPLVAANLHLDKGSFQHKSIPFKFERISADLSSQLDLEKKSPSSVNIKKLVASFNKNDISVTGILDDLLNNMVADVNVKGDLALSTLGPILPKDLPLQAVGQGAINLKVHTTLDQIQKMDLQHIKADCSIALSDLDVIYDSIHATSPKLDIALRMPVKKHSSNINEVISAHVVSGRINVEMPKSDMNVNVTNPDLLVGLSNFMDKKQKLAASFVVDARRMGLTMDSIEVHSDSLHLNGNIRYDSTRKNILQQLDPKFNVDMRRTLVYTPQIPEAVRFTSLSLSYTPEKCSINEVDLHWGLSDYHLSGDIENLEHWLSDEGMLKADLAFKSNYTDVDQLLSLISGIGSDKDSLEAQRAEAAPQDRDANPFIVPKNMNVTLHTNIKRCVAFGNDLTNLGGNVTVNDGVAILDQIGFVCQAARMQLTAVYKSPRFNHLFAALDFHLLDIQIDELIDMVPSIDTLVPMLASFKGNADFHFAAETYLTARYQPKMSTLLASAALSGKDLVVLDNETFDKIASLLMFKKKTENKIDSLDVEMTVFRNELEIYPFLLSMDKYQVCASGIQSLDSRCNYHLELLKSPLPIRLAVDVKGDIKKPKIELGSVKYAELYNPEKQNQLQARTMAVKKLVRESLEANVR